MVKASAWARYFLAKRLGVSPRWIDIVAAVVVLKENAESRTRVTNPSPHTRRVAP